jgi:hypothetical protein
MACLSPYSDDGNSGGGLSGQASQATRPAAGEAHPEVRGAEVRRHRRTKPASSVTDEIQGVSLDRFARALLEEKLRLANKEWRRCARKPGADEVHDLRVSLRRFGENLWLFRRLFPKRERKQVRSELKTVMGLTGAVRDADVAIEGFEKAGVEAGLACRIALNNARATAEAALAAALAVGLRTNVAGRWSATLHLAGQGGNADGQPSDTEGQP